jgi:hypothetical protein
LLALYAAPPRPAGNGRRVATEMKAGLESQIETYEADARLKERREQKGPRRS